jgi:sugar/nucleoside kinase (ribokinase family)
MKRYDLVGIGNAIVDVLAPSQDAVLSALGIEKGIMQLIERDRAETLYAAMSERSEVPGGSVANTVAGAGNLGLRSAFIGRVADDALGRFFAAALAAEGTDFPNPPVAGADLPTSRSMIFVTPDGERSMNTYLGISAAVGPADVDPAVAGAAEILFLEGYLFDKDPGKAAFRAAAAACRAGGGRAGIALSDPFCVDRHRGDFRALVAGPLDYTIGNSHEWCALYQTGDLEAALAQAAADCDLVVCTRSGEDVLILAGGQRIEVPVHRITPVDATGAGDQFAAGLLFGMVRGFDLATAGLMGCLCAAEVIGHLGARPESDMLSRFRAHGLMV